MPVKVVQMFSLHCDECGEELLFNNDVAVFQNSDEVEVHADQSGWKFYSRKWYCNECISEIGEE